MSTTIIRNNIQPEQTGFKKANSDDFDTYLKWIISVGRRSFNWHRTIKIEKEDLQVTDFTRNKNMEDEMTEDRCLWRLGKDRWLLAVYILIITIGMIIIILFIIIIINGG